VVSVFARKADLVAVNRAMDTARQERAAMARMCARFRFT
jgi:hypothetical protein